MSSFGLVSFALGRKATGGGGSVVVGTDDVTLVTGPANVTLLDDTIQITLLDDQVDVTLT